MASTTNKFDLNLKNGIINTIRNMPAKLEKRYLNKSLQLGANIVEKYAVTAAKAFDDPATPQMIWKQIAVVTAAKLGRQNLGVALSIGIKGGAAEPTKSQEAKNPTKTGQTYSGPGQVYYWRFLEFGTSKMAAKPFMRPALADHVEEVTDAITGGINSGLDQLATGN